MTQIKESDWKVFRRLHPIALERFCRRVIQETNRETSECNGDYHKRYLEIFRLLKRRDKELGWAFDDFRRSTAFIMIANIMELDVLTEEEFSQFSPETREVVESIVRIRHS